MAVWYYCDDIVSNNTSQADYLRIEVSNGGPWVLLEEVRAITTAWTTKSYNLANFVTLTADVRIRFIASDLLNNSVTEAAIDDFVVRVGSCVENNCPADLDGDGTVGSADLAALLSAWGSGKIDLDGDGVAGSSDLAAMLSAWGRLPVSGAQAPSEVVHRPPRKGRPVSFGRALRGGGCTIRHDG